jgi:hypothetical protein
MNTESPFPTPDTSAAALAALVHSFEQQQIPKPAWTHEAHVLVGLWYVLHDSDPLERMRSGIQLLNSAQGVETTPTGGYHETLTRFYVWALDRLIGGPPRRQVAELPTLGQQVLAYASRELPLSYYSRPLLYSPAARFGWVPPDLRPLDG